MYALKPAQVFVHKRVYANPLALARLNRMLSGLGHPAVEVVDEKDTERIIAAVGVADGQAAECPRWRQGAEKRGEDPAFLFNTFVWDKTLRTPRRKEYRNSLAATIASVMAGVGEDFAFSERNPSLLSPENQHVCQGGWGIHSLKGCVHKCDYCEEGYLVNFMLDLEEFAEHVLRMMERRPQQKLYRYDLYSDSICFEPEYGASQILAETFAKTEDKYLLFYTKSANVEHLLNLPHKEHSIFYCTLATDTVCREIERGTPGMEQRIDALRRCQKAGYVVRVGFSPIVPVRDWRSEATECLEKLFAAVKPDTVRLWVVAQMEAREAERILDMAKLDPQFVQAMREAAGRMAGKFNAPFPPEVRAEIYSHYIDEIKRLSPQTPVSLCSEELQVWRMLADKLAMAPDDLYCCCGGTSVPSHCGGRHGG